MASKQSVLRNKLFQYECETRIKWNGEKSYRYLAVAGHNFLNLGYLFVHISREE